MFLDLHQTFIDEGAEGQTELDFVRDKYYAQGRARAWDDKGGVYHKQRYTKFMQATNVCALVV